MQLIAPLASGIASAASGSVAIYRRGSTTRATYYTDFEGDSAVTPTANVTLDSAGSLVAYVDELVTCVVYDSTGTAVRTFVAGNQATSTEVRSQSFTGTNYETGASAAEDPTTEAAIFDLWKTNAGAIDWKVLFGGTATTIQAALSGLFGLVYNVQSSTYGATGDGSTDDTTAIQAAITACNAAGGGIVWFPEGTYRTTSALTLSDKVSLIGAGAHCTSISVDHASANAITLSGSTTRVWQDIRGLRILAAQNNTGIHVSVAAGSLARILDCHLGSSATLGPCVSVATSTTTRLRVSGCTFTCGNGASAVALTMAGRALDVAIEDCTFVAPATMSSAYLVSARDVTVNRCVFDLSALTSGTVSAFVLSNSGGRASVTNCVFTADGGAGTTTALTISALSINPACVFYEDGNSFACDTAYAYTFDATSQGANVHLGTRLTRTKVDAHTGASYTAPIKQYGIVKMVSTEAGNVSVTVDGFPPLGARSLIMIDNDNGSNRNFTPLSTVFTSSGAKTINTTQGNSMDCTTVEYQETGVASPRIQNVWAE